jgi:hypothetical protein
VASFEFRTRAAGLETGKAVSRTSGTFGSLNALRLVEDDTAAVRGSAGVAWISAEFPRLADRVLPEEFQLERPELSSAMASARRSIGKSGVAEPLDAVQEEA